MHQITVKNFALFKESTSFKFSPLTLLIGSNGSGKSSLIKLLNLIEFNNRFHETDKFNLKDFSSQVFNTKKPYVVSYEVANNLYCEKKVGVHYHDPMEPSISYNERNVSYINSLNQEILKTKPFLIDSSLHMKITIDIPLFYELLNENSLIELQNKLLLSGIPERKINFDIKLDNEIWGEKGFEIWFFKVALFKLFESNAIDLVVTEEDFNKDIISLFKPFYYEASKSQLEKSRNRIKLDIIRLGDIGEPKAVFSNEDNFGKTLSVLNFYTQFPPYNFDPQEFIDYWVKIFFGDNSEFIFRKIHKKHEYFEVQLNGKNMPEQGTGVFRILHIICKLSMFGGGDLLSLFGLNKNDNKKTPFIKRKFLVIEEPETNLHPDFQVKLAEMIFDLTSKLNTAGASNNLGKTKKLNHNSNYNIIVETHSEYMIRTFQYLTAKNEGSQGQIGIINFGTDKNLGKVKHISIKPNGGLSDNFFSGFFNYSEDLRLKLDAINNKRNN